MQQTTNKVFNPRSIADALLDQSRRDNFQGHDPFDALNSVLFDRLGGNRLSFVRIAWLQLHKRSPVNFRQIVGVPKQRNPKGVALIILGILERYRINRCSDELDEAVALGDWLLSQCVDRNEWGHYAWGYHFDWAARAFYVPRGKPNAITTCYVSAALHSLGCLTGFLRFTDASSDAGLFLDSLYVNTQSGGYYAYIPGESAFVHNASLWSAALVARTATQLGDDDMRQRAFGVARESASMQRHDGAWMYGTRPHHAFIDGFHTGYNLEALNLLQKTLRTDEFSEIIKKGMNYYRRKFFLADGTVKYYNDRVWPLDTHSVAQAVVTLIKVGGTDEDVALAKLVLSRAHETLYLLREQRFVYQKGRWFRNRINYQRWTQAWAFYALSLYAGRTLNSSGESNEAY